ncbi:hypothetical protein CAP39_13390 [Sphingomonas sp. IBVSS1]|nr:hypothetical protein CAP39_13390 [Sphingomonas sp. IBVSS1]
MASDAPMRQPPMLPPTSRTLWLLGCAGLWALYWFVFITTGATSPLRAALVALANVLPLALLILMTHSLLRSHVMALSVPRQAAAHAVLAPAFGLLWYAGVLMCLAIVNAADGTPFVLRAFAGPALPWQVFQGLVIYVAVVASCYAIRGGRAAANLTIVDAPATPPRLERYLTRDGDELAPVLVGDIIAIQGAQDYSEVTTLGGRHLVRLSLAEFEARLDPQRFLRVHRSTIINFDHLVRAEPAGGGRLTLHLRSGDSVQASRAGAQLLRTFMV